jgi:hypothetical protein
MMHVNRFGEPSFLLLVQRRTEEFEEQSIYHLAQSGDVSAIAKSLRLGRALPNDAADLTGATALHVSTYRRSQCRI